MSSDNILIRASAGSGKTFQLSNRYLSLAFGGAAWETMLASTFTKKAAGEILDRILLRLADAALHEKSRLDLAGFLKRPNDLSRQEVLDLLLQSVRNLHRLRVGTLDSFFIQIASSFCLELGIPLGWQIAEELDEQRFLAEAVREVFQQTDKADAVRLMHLLSKGEVARSISEEAFSLSKKLIQLYRDSPKDAWEKLPKHSSLSSEELEQAIELYANAELPKHKTIEKQRITDIDRIHNGDWASFFSSGPAKIIVTKKEYVYCTKNIEGDYKEALDKIIKHAKTELINKLAIQTEATGELLGRVLEQYERIKEENRALRFDDITFKLSCARLQDRLEQIVHRIDSPIHHLLLDEFQDTSPLQWDVLRPFVFAAIASAKRSDGSFFCVGDEKQAIYGWRGGVAAIFSTIEKEITPLRIEPLQKSYRSSQPVIDTVNAVFRDLPHNAVLAEHPDYLDAAKHWRFNNHETDKKELSGYCTLEVAPLYDPDKVEESFWDDTEEDEESGEAESKQAHTTLNFAIRRIAGLHRETPQATLGVLVRTNDPVGWIIRGLKKLGIDASEEGGNPLTDSPAVEMILSALTLADHPGDTVCRFHLASGPLGSFLELTDEKDDSQAAKKSQEIRSNLLDKGYGAVIAEWIDVLVPSCDQRNLDRLLQLLQLAYSWETHAPIRVDRFVEMVKTTRIESPSAAKIRVMTIHQAKGLEFDIVVLPELHKKLIGQPPQVVVGHKAPEDPTSPIDRIVRYTNETEQSFLPDSFRKMFENYRREQVEESLCLLYVAMTRAVHRLCMIVPPIKTKPSKTFDGVLRSALSTADRIDEPLSILYEHGDPNWSAAFNKKHPPQDEPGYPVVETAEIALNEHWTPRRNLPRMTPSQLEGTETSQPEIAQPEIAQPREQISSQQVGSPKDRRQAMLWGTAIHTCFEKAFAQSPWWDQQRPNRDELLQVLGEWTQSQSAEIKPEKVVDTFFKICENAEIRAALSLPKQTDGLRYEVDSERNFVIRSEGGILHGSIDRLVVAYRGEQVVSAEIFDYKTDAFRPAEGEILEKFLEEKKEFYAPQLRAYKAAVSRLYRLPEEKITATLVFTSPGKIVHV